MLLTLNNLVSGNIQVIKKLIYMMNNFRQANNGLNKQQNYFHMYLNNETWLTLEDTKHAHAFICKENKKNV